jgi:hypothetical protein
LSMMLGIISPVLAPTTALAASQNSVDKILSVADDYTGKAATLTIKEDTDFPTHFTAGETFKVVLPSGVKWDAASLTATFNGGNIVGTDAKTVTDQTMEVTIPAGASGAVDKFDIGLGIEVDGAIGDIAVTVDPMDSAVTGGTYTFARVQSGNTTTVAESVETIGASGAGGKIRIDEVAVGAIGNGVETITLKLPSNFKWDATMTAADVVLSGGFLPAVAAPVITGGIGTTTLTVTFNPAAARTQRGTIYITPKIKAEKNASYGDISVNVTGTDLDDADVVVAKYADFSAKVTIKEVKELLAGKLDDVKTAKITIEELVPGTFLGGRDLSVELPEWVKITNIRSFNVTGGNPAFRTTVAPTVGAGAEIDGTENEFDIRIAASTSGGTCGKIEFELDLSIEGNKSGEIEATVSGAGVPSVELVVAKAVAPVTAEATCTDIKVGVQDQVAADVIIAEGKKGALEKTAEMTAAGVNGEIRLVLSQGVKFAAKPTVAVIEGNLELKTDEVKLDQDDTEAVIYVKSESSKISKIKVSGIKLTADRTIPEGEVLIKVQGSSVIENSKGAIGWLGGVLGAGNAATLDAGEFDTGTAVSVKIANVVTPAPFEQKSTVVFNIGDTKYTVNGVEQTMDASAYIKNGRTYLPVRYVAYALGVNADNIMWDGKNVTLLTPNKVVQVAIGSKVMLINGISVAMDVAPELVQGRTMLPFKWIAQALGATVSWDEATQTVTMVQ